MFKRVSCLLILFWLFPGAIHAGIDVQPSQDGQTQQVCQTPPSYDAVRGVSVPASNCSSAALSRTGNAEEYVDPSGNTYNYVCADIPSRDGGGGLSVTATTCAYVVSGRSVAPAGAGGAAESQPTNNSGLVPCGGPGQETCQACHAVTLMNNVLDWLVGILAVVFALIVMTAGFNLVTSSGNTSAKEKAKSMITNATVGFVIVLAAWLLIDYGMKMLVSDAGASVQLGTWNAVECTTQPTTGWKAEPIALSNPENALAGSDGWSGNGVQGQVTSECDADGIDSSGNLSYNCSAQVAQCARVTGSSKTNSAGSAVTCIPSTGGTVGANGLGQCSTSNGACSPAALRAAGLTEQQSNIMSCIAMTESSGIASTPPYNVTHPGSNSSACGTFQVVKKTWDGYATGACRGHAANCRNASCNTQVMTALVNRNGYSDWTCANCNAKAKRCISQYDG